MDYIAPGALVEFKEVLEPGDDQEMIVLEDRGDRVLVEGYVPGFKYQPTRVVSKEDIEEVG